MTCTPPDPEPPPSPRRDSRRRRAALAFGALLLVACSPSGPAVPSGPVAIPMRDGIELATDLYFPEEGSPPYPVVLLRTPYNKSWVAGYGQYYARAGFAVAIQDVRGRWASQGDWEPFVHEGPDGYDTIEWLGTRPWSTGKVGMVGGSYSGTAQFQAAALQPPHLVTIIPNVAPAVPFHNIPRTGGALALGWALRWADLVENAHTGQELQQKLRASLTADWAGPLSSLPVIDLDRAVVGRDVPYFRDWVRHEPGDGYWDTMSYLQALERVDIPVFLQGGWFDPGVGGTPLAFEHLIRGGNHRVRCMIGPWIHGDRGSRHLNGIDMGAEAERDLMHEYRKWLDFFLKTDGRDAAKEPGVELYLMGTNRWIGGPQYPPAGTATRRLYLAGPAGVGAPGGLAWEAPAVEDAADTFTYDPATPTPSFHAALKRGALAEYRQRIDSGRDVRVYETAPLEAALDIVGPVELELHAASSAKDTDWTATLYGLTADGEVRVLGLTFGILRARYRDSLTDPSLLEPDRPYAYTLDLGHTAVTIQPGERLRLEVASAAFPEFSRNLNTGRNNESTTEYVSAHQRVFRSAGRPSHLRLPVLEQR